jgi:hypothetical protein
MSASSYVNFVYPTSRQLVLINPEKIIDLQRNRPTFQLFPDQDFPEWRLEWEQKDNYRGFQQLRGLNGEPSYVKMVGFKRLSQEPGVFGEYMTVDEMQMTTRAQLNVEGSPINITDLITERQDYLNARETDLKEWMHWSIILAGTFSIIGPTGAKYGATFPVQTATFSDWHVHSTATPMADFLGLKTLTRGKSVTFGGGADAWMNSTETSNLMLNSNPNDLGGQRITPTGISVRVGSPISMDNINTIFASQAIPQVHEYDEGYNRESDGAFTLWLPDGIVAIIGKRTNGDPLGKHRMVRNINNPGSAPGRYTKVIDNLDRDVPRKISVHQGHNGGLVLFYASAIIKATVH